MKVWWRAALSIVILAAGVARAADSTPVKGPGGESIGLVLACNDCQKGSGSKCFAGAEEGWLQGKPCGKCLVAANSESPMKYHYDLHFAGKLTSASGKPVKERFVKLFLTNGWGVRTRTDEDGSFRLMLGATEERKVTEPVVIDLGTFVDNVKNKNDEYFAMFFVLPDYKPCDTAAAPNAAPKKSGAQH